MLQILPKKGGAIGGHRAVGGGLQHWGDVRTAWPLPSVLPVLLAAVPGHHAATALPQLVPLFSFRRQEYSLKTNLVE